MLSSIMNVKKMPEYLLLEVRNDDISEGNMDLVSTFDNIVKHAPCHLVFDFSHVNQLTSSAISMLLRLRRELAWINKRLGFINMRPEIIDLLRSTNLTGILRSFPDPDSFLRDTDS